MRPAEGRQDTDSLRSADELARERVIRILDRIARQGVPVRASEGRRPERHLELARIRAERLGDASLWTSLVAASVPYSPRDRAESQAALLDLVTAAVTEDLLEASDVRLLRDDGQQILDLPTLAMSVSSGDRVGMAPRVLPVNRR